MVALLDDEADVEADIEAAGRGAELTTPEV